MKTFRKMIRCLALLAFIPVVSMAADLSDDFSGTLGNWTQDGGTWAIIGNQLAEEHLVAYTNGMIRYTGSGLDGINQYNKKFIANVGASVIDHGFIFRNQSSLGNHYQLLRGTGADDWTWAYYTASGFESIVGSCNDGESVGSGDYLGATITGTGNDTVVSVWRWDSDPDSGATPDPDANWGPADCTITDNPSTPDDAGTYVGIRMYRLDTQNKVFYDDWFAGDYGDVPLGPSIGLLRKRGRQ